MALRRVPTWNDKKSISCLEEDNNLAKKPTTRPAGAPPEPHINCARLRPRAGHPGMFEGETLADENHGGRLGKVVEPVHLDQVGAHDADAHDHHEQQGIQRAKLVGLLRNGFGIRND